MSFINFNVFLRYINIFLYSFINDETKIFIYVYMYFKNNSNSILYILNPI